MMKHMGTTYSVPKSNFRTNHFNYDSNGREVLEALALGVWLGDGTKNGKRVVVTNCNPAILKIWLQYLKEVCQVDMEKVYLRLNLHDPSTAPEVIPLWHDSLGEKVRVEVRQKKVYTTTPTRPKPMGTACLMFNSKFLREFIAQRASEVAEGLM